MMQLWRQTLTNFSSKSTTSTGPMIKIINSHEKTDSKEAANVANEKRLKEIKEFQREFARVRRSNATFAKQFPTRLERIQTEKSERFATKQAAWSKYVEGIKKSLNPAVQELQESGKIRKIDEARREGKRERGQQNLIVSQKPVILMRRKYLNHLSTETIPILVNSSNLESKIQEALDNPCNYNLTGEGVVEVVKEVKRKLREIRVPMEEYEPVNLKMESESKGII